MQTYEIRIKKRARKFIESQDKKSQRRIMEEIDKLPYNASDIKKIKDAQNGDLHRLRVGDFRIGYRIHKNELLVMVIHADNRGDFYKWRG